MFCKFQLILALMFLTVAVLSLVVSCALGDPSIQLWVVDAPKESPAVEKLADVGYIDVWSSNSTHAQILVEPEVMPLVQQLLEESQINYWVEVEDVMSLVQQERQFMKEVKERTRRTRAAQQMDWNTYHNMDDIEGFIGWVNATQGNLVRVLPAATTAEGRRVLVVKLTDPNSPGPKKKIWIEGGIHAREWISPAVSTYILNLLVTDESWRDLLKVTEWYIVPVANPDGYQYTFTSDRARLWRKNRRDNGSPDGRCKGVDLNRNWNLKWGVGASKNPCSETYRGDSPFSEPETRGLQAMMKEVGDIDLFITFHSFGQTILYPWGWTRNPPANVKQLKNLAKKFADTVREMSRGETEYEIGGSGPLYGLASGATDDWAYGALGVPYSYTIELPDQGQYQFLLPESRISSTVVETAAGIKCMIGSLTNTGFCAARRVRRPDIFWFRSS
ncbi:carboxypeptidase B isoform X1 [Procambarus clarkii]|uniref:carboxypeptidase B isoform X1 n=2 Tax=Procambarus clarkii TaxID=6728 RepID=UPI0037425153